MNDIIIKINKLDRTVLPEKTIIGNDGENLQCKLVFEFEDNFVDGIGRVEYSAGEDKNYIWISKEDNKYYLPIKDVVTKEGNVNFQLVITEEQTTDGIPLFKSNVFTLYCKESINAVEEAPEGYELWIDQANQKIMEMDNLNIEVEKIDNVCYITLTDKEGNTKVVTVNDGNGIVSIEKTSTSGLVDTYTIIFTDGTTTTFQVTNGADGEVTIEQFEQAMMVYNALPKVSDTNTTITLNDTAKCPLKLDLKGNTSQNGTPTPSSPVNINTVSGNNNIFISNKNLNSKGIRSGLYVTSTGAYAESTTYVTINDLLPIKYNQTITVSTQLTRANDFAFFILEYDNNKTYLNVNSGGVYGKSITYTVTNPNTRYIAIDIGSSATMENVGNIQVELGTVKSSYEAYQGQTYPISLGTIELCKYNDYQDYIYKSNDKWYLHKEIEKTTLTGSENISGYGFGNYYRYSVSTSTLNITPKSNTSMLSNYFYHDPQTLDSGSCQVGMFFYASNYSNIYFISNENNAANFKTWLGTHNTKIYYILANATDTEITDSTLINQLNDLAFAYSYNTQTNIIQSNNDLPFIITATGIRTLENIFNGGA